MLLFRPKYAQKSQICCIIRHDVLAIALCCTAHSNLGRVDVAIAFFRSPAGAQGTDLVPESRHFQVGCAGMFCMCVGSSRVPCLYILYVFGKQQVAIHGLPKALVQL